MRIINATTLNTKSLTDLISHAGIDSERVAQIRFVEASNRFLAEDSNGWNRCLGFANVSEKGRNYVVRFCGNEDINDKSGTSTVEILLHELEHIRQMTLGLDLKWSDERLENAACKAELNVRG